MILRNILTALNAISDLAQALLRGMGSGPRQQMMPAAFYCLVYARISRTENALRGLAERMARLGRVPVRRAGVRAAVERAPRAAVERAPRAAVERAPRAAVERAPRAATEVVKVGPPEHSWAIPRRRGWLLWWGREHAGLAAAQLRAVLDAPEMEALLAQSASARRLVRSLCFALGIKVEEIGRDRRAAEIRGEIAWREAVPSCSDAGWVADAWALVWARPGGAARVVPCVEIG